MRLSSAEALGAIWALAFDETNRDKMVEDGSVVELIIKLKDSTVESVRTQAGNILWTLREELARSPNKLFQQTGAFLGPLLCYSTSNNAALKTNQSYDVNSAYKIPHVGHRLIFENGAEELSNQINTKYTRIMHGFLRA